MPYSRYSRRSSLRRPWSRRVRFARTNVASLMRARAARYASAVPPTMRNVVLMPKQGFPERLTVNLPYQKAYRSSPGVLTGTDDIFSLSNMTDLDVSGGGAVGQARGWDQWSPMYSRYRINYVRVDIKARQRAAHGIQVLRPQQQRGRHHERN